MAMARASWLPSLWPGCSRCGLEMVSLLSRSSGHVQNDASRGLQEGAGVRSICTVDVAGCLLMVPLVLCFQLLPVGREGCRVVHDTCKAVRRITSTCSTSKAKRSRAHEEAGQRRRVRGVPRRSEPHSPSSASAPDVVD